MTNGRGEDRRPASLDIPLTRVAGGRKADHRSRIAALATIAFAATIVVLALPRQTPAGITGGQGPSATSAALGTSRPSFGPTLRPRPPSPTPVPETLPDVANNILFGAPRPSFYRRTGDDLEVLAWSAGAGRLAVAGTIPDAYAGFDADDTGFGSVSPNGRLVLVQRFPAGRDGTNLLRLVDLDDGLRWDGEVPGLGAVIWSPDSRWFAIGSGDQRWLVAHVESADVEALVYNVPEQPEAPASSAAPPTDSRQIDPIAFSRDGRWIYGATISPLDGAYHAAVRVAVADGTVEPIAQLPATGPAAAVTEGGHLPEADPVTGRTFLPSRNADIEVAEPDGLVAFTVDHEYPAPALTWTDDGRLVVVDGGQFAASVVDVRLIGPDGVPQPQLFQTDRPARVALIDHRAGYLLVVFTIREPEARALLVLIRLTDGYTAAIELDESTVDGIVGLGWLD